jgi:hypothetical protein
MVAMNDNSESQTRMPFEIELGEVPYDSDRPSHGCREYQVSSNTNKQQGKITPSGTATRAGWLAAAAKEEWSKSVD